MAGKQRFGSGFRQGSGRSCALGLCLALPCAAASALQHAAKRPAGTSQAARTIKDPWQTALVARRSFEAEPREEHTRDEFTQVMGNFRAIYHDDPSSSHAPGAVNQVAELLAEQGRELNDRKSLRAAAGQYEFLAKAYPASSLAAPARVQARQLLAGDAVEEQSGPDRSVPAKKEPIKQNTLAVMKSSVSADRLAKDSAAGRPVEIPEAEPVESATLDGRPLPEGAAPAIVTGIRHWSTASYTRVAIDLGGEVQYKAARTEHPDRIFFDLHGAKLAPGLVGKTFAVTDDGFLSTIRAAQAGPDVTRVVLDVQPVAEYSAFLLPNPYRLIIDIHGKAASSAGAEAKPIASTREAVPPSPVKNDAGKIADGPEQPAAPITRAAPGPASARPAGGSTLPPMPVTDGSASFGLPARRSGSAAPAQTAVARPRVVVTAKPTTAKPVPNTTTSATPDSSREVAALGDTPGIVTATAQPTSNPVVDRKPDSTGARRRRGTSATTDTTGTNAEPVTPPPPTSDGQSTLMRALGLKIGRIVIDAGHGGHDSGTLGSDGIEEKDVVLDVALRLGKLLHDRLGAEVVYTRADDTFIPLETRTAIANKAQADLFISVHANSSGDPSARGVEVYYLNFTSDPEAMQVASRENAVSSQRVNQLSDLVKKIALKDKIDESRELAADVDQSLYSGLRKGNSGLKDRGVKKAPFVVLIGANMPSILAEISFVTNPDDAAELQQPEYRERVAESLYTGIARYAGAINGAKSKTMERAQR